MKEQIKRSNYIRLADGREGELKIIKFPNGQFGIIFLAIGAKPERIILRQFDDKSEAQNFLEYLKEEKNVSELKGRYKQLAIDLRKAAIYGREHMGDNDSGSFNFDSPYLILPRWREKLVIDAAKTAGISCFKSPRSSGRFIFNIPDTGTCSAQTRAAEAMSDYLGRLGYSSGVWYMLD